MSNYFSSVKRILVTVALYFVCGHAFGQLLTNNNISVTISSGTQLTVKGDVLNTSGTTVSNSGTIDLTGNWTNNTGGTVFGTSQGEVTLNGVNQSIQGSDQTVFNTLNLQNGVKTLQLNTTVGGANATPAGILNVNDAVLDLNAKVLMVKNPSGGAVTASTGYILSEQTDNSAKVIWGIGTTTGIHTVPFGNAGGVQIPFSFDLTAGNAGDVTASTYPTAANNTPYPTTPVAVTHFRNIFGADNSVNAVDRFWQVDATGTPTASLTFSWAASEIAANGSLNPKAQRWEGLAWQSALAGQTNPTTQSVLVPAATVFGPWAVALSESPLPIQLLSFTATPVDNKRVLCKWTTASEVNNDYFNIQRSKNGTDFENIGVVDGAGNSTVMLNYDFADEHPFSGISYYRLKQTDFNGAFSFSKIVPVTIRKEGGLTVYPAFTSGEVYFMSQETIFSASVKIIDAQGKLIFDNQISIEGNSGKIDLSAYSSGLYFIHFSLNNSTEVFKVVKM